MKILIKKMESSFLYQIKKSIISFFIFTFINLFVIIYEYDFLFRAALIPGSDAAANDMLIFQAKHSGLLHGNWSRIGFYHPGPFYLSMIALYESVLLDKLHLFQSPIAVAIYFTVTWSALSISLLFYLIWRATDRLAIALTATAAAVIMLVNITGMPDAAGTTSFLTEPWPPYLYVSSTLMFATGGMGLFIFGIRWLPLMVFGAMQLIHGHASFIGLVPLMSLIILIPAFWYRQESWPGLARLAEQARASRWPLLGTLLIIAVFLAPIILGQILDPEVNLWRVFSYAANTKHLPRRQALDLVQHYLPLFPIPLLPFLLPASLAPTDAVASVFRRVRMASLVVFTGGLAGGMLYAFRGIDLFGLYLLLWFGAFSAILTAGAVICVLVLVSQRAAWGAVACLLLLAGTGWGSARSLLGHQTSVFFVYRAAPYETALEQIRHLAADRTVLRLRFEPSFAGIGEALALMALMIRHGERMMCIEPDDWILAFNSVSRCQAPQDRVNEHAELYVGPIAPPGGGLLDRLTIGNLYQIPR